MPNKRQTLTSSVKYKPSDIDDQTAAITLADTRAYACSTMLALQDKLTALSICLDRLKRQGAANSADLILQMKNMIQQINNHLKFRLYNIRPYHLNPSTFRVCNIDDIVNIAIKAISPDQTILPFLQWNNDHNFYFRGISHVVQAMIANLIDTCQQASQVSGKQGHIKLWSGYYRRANALHCDIEAALETRRQDKNWPIRTVNPGASFRLTLSLCQQAMSAFGGKVLCIDKQTPGVHLVLSFPTFTSMCR